MDDGGAWSASAKLPPLDLTEGFDEATLSFVLYMDVEDQECGADFLSVRVNGAEAFSYCTSTGGNFLALDVDLGIFIGAVANVEIVFNTVSALANDGMGAVIDNVRVERTCGGAP